jgi:uncharacterized membrane protein
MAGPFRLAAVDAARGVAIAAMVVYHFAWDLSLFGLIETQVTAHPGWIAFARGITGAFLGLVGVGLVLAAVTGQPRARALRRLGLIGGAALLVSLGSWWFNPSAFIFFGILHLIAVASVLALPFLRAPLWVLGLAIAGLLAGPHVLAHPAFNGFAWYWLGLSTATPPSPDLVPVFPWLALVLGGVVLGRAIVAGGPRPWWGWQPRGWLGRVLVGAGRWSLPIYLVHQPVLIGALLLLAPAPPAPDDPGFIAAWRGQFMAACLADRQPEAACDAYAACLLRGFGGVPPGPADARWARVDGTCRADTGF